MKTAAPIILIADDDLDDLELLEEQLLQVNENITVHTVMSGKEVARFIENCASNQIPHLIVLDYNIPDMNGLDIFRMVQGKASLWQVPVVFWSTSSSPQLQAACEQAGAHSFITKPTTIEGTLAIAHRIVSICKL